MGPRVCRLCFTASAIACIGFPPDDSGEPWCPAALHLFCGPPCPGGLLEMQILRPPSSAHIRTCTLLGSPGSPKGNRDLPCVPVWLHVHEKIEAHALLSFPGNVSRSPDFWVLTGPVHRLAWVCGNTLSGSARLSCAGVGGPMGRERGQCHSGSQADSTALGSLGLCARWSACLRFQGTWGAGAFVELLRKLWGAGKCAPMR